MENADNIQVIGDRGGLEGSSEESCILTKVLRLRGEGGVTHMRAKAKIAGPVGAIRSFGVVRKCVETVPVDFILELLGQCWVLGTWKGGNGSCLVTCDAPEVCGQQVDRAGPRGGGCRRQDISQVHAVETRSLQPC